MEVAQRVESLCRGSVLISCKIAVKAEKKKKEMVK